MDDLYDGVIYGDVEQQRFMDKPNLRMLVSRIREQVVSEFSFSLISPSRCIWKWVNDHNGVFMVHPHAHLLCWFFFLSVKLLISIQCIWNVLESVQGDKQLFFYSLISVVWCFSLWWLHAQFQKFAATDLLWWRGLARIMEDKGYIREGEDRVYSRIDIPF